MMAQRSLIRPDQLNPDGAYSFAQLTLDGYSGGDENDGYLTALVLVDRQTTGNTTLTIESTNGAISQTGTGQVSFAGNVNATSGLDVTGADLTVANDAHVTGSVFVTTNVTINGDLTVLGTETIINTEQLYIKDPIAVFNDSGVETESTWTGFSARDTDGYNRFGWTFDGYWALSDSATAGADAAPTRPVAYVAATPGLSGDLSSTTGGSSGADKIGVSTISGLAGNDVQTCLENLAAGTAEITGTTHLTFAINSDATPAVDEDPCLIMKGGDGTRLIEGYMCLITVAGTNDDYFQFRTYADGTPEHTIVQVGPNAATDDIDAYLYLNAGTGAAARQASFVLDGTNDNLKYTATAHEFAGGVTMDNALTVTGTTTLNGALYANGNTTIGSDSADSLTVSATITSNLLPTDCSYQLGNTSNKWDDGYFCLFTPVHYTPVGSNYSLEGHLKGIDAALALTSTARAVYVITAGEAASDSFDTSRAADQGTAINLSTLTDAEFRDYIHVYWNGQLLYNDAASAANKAAVQHDTARKTGDLKTLLFAGDLKKGNIIQIVDMRITA